MYGALHTKFQVARLRASILLTATTKMGLKDDFVVLVVDLEQLSGKIVLKRCLEKS